MNGLNGMIAKKMFGKPMKGKKTKMDKVLAKVDAKATNPPKGIAVGKIMFKKKSAK